MATAIQNLSHENSTKSCDDSVEYASINGRGEKSHNSIKSNRSLKLDYNAFTNHDKSGQSTLKSSKSKGSTCSQSSSDEYASISSNYKPVLEFTPKPKPVHESTPKPKTDNTPNGYTSIDTSRQTYFKSKTFSDYASLRSNGEGNYTSLKGKRATYSSLKYLKKEPKSLEGEEDYVALPVPRNTNSRISRDTSDTLIKSRNSGDYTPLRNRESVYTSLGTSRDSSGSGLSTLDLGIVNNLKNGNKALRCLHTFCTMCMQQVVLIKKSGVEGFKCPTCLRFSQKGDYSHLFIMDDFYDIFKMSCSRKEQCSRCRDKETDTVETAQWRCLNCKLNLCDACQQLHESAAAHRGHKYVSGKRVPLYLITQSVYCPDHPDQMEGNLYCRQCDKCVCHKCMTSNHAGHNTESILAATERITELVDNGLNKIENDMKELVLESAFLEKEAKFMEEAYSNTEKEYQKNYENTLHKLKHQYEQDIEVLHRRREQDNAKISSALKEIEAQVKDMRNTLLLAKYAMQNTRGSSLIKALDGGLQEKIVDEGNKPMSRHILSVEVPHYKTDDYVNIAAKCKNLLGTPDYKEQEINYEITRFCNGRQIGGSFKSLLDNIKLKTVFNVNGAPKRIGLVEDKIWVCEIPNNDYILGTIFNISIYSLGGELIKTFEPEGVKNAQDVAQVNDTDVIVAGGNGLFVLTLNGEHCYKILSGHFCYVASAGHEVASVDEDTNELVVLKYVADRWQLHQSFKLHMMSENIVSLHLVKDAVYISEVDKYIHMYNMQGTLLEKHYRASDDYVFHLCGSDSHNTVISTSYHCKYLHLLTPHGLWEDIALHGVQKIDDVCVKGEYVYVLQDCSDYNNFRYRYKVCVYEINS